MVEFKFRRRLGYFMFHTYIPTCLIVMMSWISFWIKPEAVPARVTLGVTSLLTLSTQHANSQKSLPPVSYIKVKIFLAEKRKIFLVSHRVHSQHYSPQLKALSALYMFLEIYFIFIRDYNGILSIYYSYF